MGTRWWVVAGAGPDRTATWAGRLTVELGVEFPLWQRNPDLPLDGNLRLHARVTWRF